MTLNSDQLNPTDRAILDELGSGRCTPAFVAEKHDYSAGNVRNRMTKLAQHKHVRGLGGGLYELADDPRAGDEPDHSPEQARIETLEERVEDLRAERDRLAESDSVDTNKLRNLLSRATAAVKQAGEASDEHTLASNLNRASDALEDARRLLEAEDD